MVDLGKYTKNHGELRKKEIDKLVTRSLDLGNLKPETEMARYRRGKVWTSVRL